MFLLNESYLPSSFVDCFLCCFAVADLKRKLQALRNNLAEKSQQARASTLVPPPGLPVPRVLPGQEPAPCPKAMQLGNNTPSAAGKAITAFADGSLNPGLTLSPPQAPLVHPKVSVDAAKACEHTLKASTPIPCAPALTASPSVSPAISLAPHSSSSTGSKRGFAVSSSSAFGVMASAFGGGHSSSPAADHAAFLAAAMSPGTASPAVAFGSPVAKTPSAIGAATTDSDLEASPGSAAASGPPAAAPPPHASAPPAKVTPAAVRGGGGLVMPIVVAPPQSLTPDDAAVSGEPVSEKEVPPTAVATTPVFTGIAGLAEAPAPFGSLIASPEPATAVANSGADQGVITATTRASSSPATPGFTATTAAVPPAAVSGDESERLAVPEITMPEEPSGSLQSLAQAGPLYSAMPVSTAGDAQACPADFVVGWKSDLFQTLMCKAGLRLSCTRLAWPIALFLRGHHFW